MAASSPASAAGDPQVVLQVIQDTLQRIGSHKGVLGYFVLNPKDNTIMQSAGFGNNEPLKLKYAKKLSDFIQLTQSMVRSLDHDDDLTFLRMRWRQREIIMAPDYANREYLLVVVHDQVPNAPADEPSPASPVAEAPPA